MKIPDMDYRNFIIKCCNKCQFTAIDLLLKRGEIKYDTRGFEHVFHALQKFVIGKSKNLQEDKKAVFDLILDFDNKLFKFGDKVGVEHKKFAIVNELIRLEWFDLLILFIKKKQFQNWELQVIKKLVYNKCQFETFLVIEKLQCEQAPTGVLIKTLADYKKSGYLSNLTIVAAKSRNYCYIEIYCEQATREELFFIRQLAFQYDNDHIVTRIDSIIQGSSLLVKTWNWIKNLLVNKPQDEQET